MLNDLALAIAAVGALLVWAYYAPRLLATVRETRERRLLVAARPNRLERVAPGDPATDRAFARMVRHASLNDAGWTLAMRRLSSAARVAAARQGGPVR